MGTRSVRLHMGWGRGVYMCVCKCIGKKCEVYGCSVEAGGEGGGRESKRERASGVQISLFLTDRPSIALLYPFGLSNLRDLAHQTSSSGNRNGHAFRTFHTHTQASIPHAHAHAHACREKLAHHGKTQSVSYWQKTYVWNVGRMRAYSLGRWLTPSDWCWPSLPRP